MGSFPEYISLDITPKNLERMQQALMWVFGKSPKPSIFCGTLWI